MEIVSKIGTVHKPEKNIYEFLSDFRNLNQFIPGGQVTDWQANPDTCSFKIPAVGDVNIRMADRQPNKLVKLSGKSHARNVDFLVWIQLKEVRENDTRVKITLRAEMPAMLRMVAKKPIEMGLNKVIDNLDRLFGKVEQA